MMGKMADVGERFRGSDTSPQAQRLPLLRFMSAEGRGCDLKVTYERSGAYHTWSIARLRFERDGWTVALR